jgi:hypothetical protein
MKEIELHPAATLCEEACNRASDHPQPLIPPQTPVPTSAERDRPAAEREDVHKAPAQAAASARPVAVIAVHGVGYCDRFATARHIASLLLGLGRLRLREGVDWPTGGDVGQPYQSCSEEFIQIPLQRVLVSDAIAAQARLVAEPQDGASITQKIWTRLQRMLHFYAESRGYLAEVFARRRSSEQAAADITDTNRLGREFMRSQLAGYLSTQDGQAWDTIRLRTERSAPAGDRPRKVDIYECYWADLARPQGSVLSFFNALYQLLFHLASLSRTALDYATVEHITLFRWRIVSFFQAMAVRVLVIFIPILNLLLLITGLTVLPLNIGLNHQYLAAGLFGCLVFLALLFRPRRVPKHFRTWLLMLAGAYIFGFLITLLPFIILKPGTRAGDVALVVEWWLLGEIALFLLMKRYESVRRGAYRTALVLGFACAAVYFSFLWQLLHTNIPNPAEQASFWAMEVIFSILSICWVVMLLLALSTWVVHVWCLRPLHKSATRSQKSQPGVSTPELAMYARARAAFRTARLSLAVSASMISLVTVFLWAGAFSYANKSFNLFAGVDISYPPPPFHAMTSLIVPSEAQARFLVHETGTDAPAEGPACANIAARDQPILQHRLDKVERVLVADGRLTSSTTGDLDSRVKKLEAPAGIEYPSDRSYGCVDRIYLLENKTGIAGPTEFHVLARSLLLASTSSGMPLMIFLIVVAIIVLAWAVARSLIPDGAALNLANNRQCMQLADWLSRGLDSTRAVTSLFWHSIFTVPLVFGLLDYFYSRQYLTPYVTQHAWVVNGLSAFIGSSLRLLDLVGAKLALSGAAIAAIIYRYGRAPLDILLDVDNYLRTSPLENVPRARIVERYVSLLRYIAARKDPLDPQHRYYGSVVIVAHSLGALISADLLHFLKEEPDEALRPLGYGEKNQGSAEIPIRLFTFGNPLRQLLNRFFPHIYWWIREEPDNGARPVAKAADDTPDLAHLPNTPQVFDLGAAVKLWLNAYRSGDFVGRMLWSDHWYSRNSLGPDRGQYPEEVTVIGDMTVPNPKRAEMCIGLGGHNDYWNRTAPDMARQLDKLIQM